MTVTISAGQEGRWAGPRLAARDGQDVTVVPAVPMVVWLRRQIIWYRAAAVLACPQDPARAAMVRSPGDWPPDPQILADRCDAELALLGEHIPRDGFGYFGEEQLICVVCSSDDSNGLPVGDRYPCCTLRLVAAGYRRRPGWDDA